MLFILTESLVTASHTSRTPALRWRVTCVPARTNINFDQNLDVDCSKAAAAFQCEAAVPREGPRHSTDILIYFKCTTGCSYKLSKINLV